MIVTDTLFSKLLKSFVAFCAIATLGIAASTPAFADQTSKSLDVNLTLGNSISVRILDSTATSDLSLLSFDLTPTASGVTSTKRAIVDVSTSNITGYKLYVEANGKDHNNQYTTDLVQGDTADSHVIPTSTSTSSNKNFWNYVNPTTSAATVVPAHGNPDQIGMLMSPTTSTKANVDINVGVDTTITAGSYTNQLLFTAIANAESIDYTLYFDKNAPSGVDPSDIENFPVNQTASASATSYTFTIPDTAPTLVGYTFGGYVDPTATPGSKGSSADPYLPGENVTVLADPTASVISGTKTLNAKWTIIRPTLTVDPDGGTWSGSSSAQTFEQDYGTTKHIDLPSANATYTISYNDNSQGATFTPTPTSAERSFTGWSLEATRAAGPGSWDPTTSTYTFGTQNGTLTATYNETSNTFTLPTVTKTGYTCTWHEGSASGTSHDSGEANVTISANMEFFAVCTIDSYTLTVNPNGGTWGGSSSSQEFSQNYGTTKSIANPSAGPTYSISYDGNSQSASYDPTPTSVQRPFTDWTLTATPSGTAHGSFSEGTYTYGAGNDTLTANYNTTSNSFTLPQISKTGHSCKWAEGSASGTQYDGGTSRTITGNTTYFAVCTVNSYKLTVKPNGGTWETKTTDQEFTQNYGTTKDIADPSAGPTYSIDYDMGDTGITKPTSPTSVQRPFTSWTADPTSAWNSSSKVWTFPASAGTLTANYNNTSSGFTLPALPKTGYTCKWHAGSTSGTEYNPGQENVTITGNTTFYATCSINSYTLTIKPNGGKWDGKTADSTVTQNYNTRYPSSGALANATNGPTYTIDYNMGSTGITKPTSPTSVSKAFSSWTKGGEGTWNSTDKYFTFGAGDGTLTASWSNTSEGFTLPALQKTGHTCKWHPGSTSGTPAYDGGATGVTITGNTTFYATCSINSYTVTVNAGPNIASTSGGGSKQYNSTVTIGATPSTGYHFSSWTVNSGGVTINNNQFTMPANDVTVTANAAINTCEVKYNSNAPSGSSASGSMDNTSFNYNTATASRANAFSVTGYNWAGWAETESGAAVITTSGGNITAAQAASWCGTHGSTKNLYAKWTAKTYSLTLNGNGATTAGSALATATYKGTTLSAITVPQRKYTLSGWGKNQSGYNASDATITNSSNCTTSSNGCVSTYTFNGWYKESGATNKIASNAATPALQASTSYTNSSSQWTNDGAVTLYAGWTGQTRILPSITKTGYSCGWTTAASGASTWDSGYSSGATVTPNGNKTLYGICTINSYTLTVNPNGGTWGGSTSSQNFTQNYNTTKTISNPTAGPTYTISYNANGQGASYTGSPTSVQRPFSSWSLSGAGSFAGNTYTYGAGNGTLMANYSTTSNYFTLPTITKSGYTCHWAKGSASGDYYASGATYVDINSNTTFFAVCEAQTLVDACNAAENNATFTYSGVTYIKLGDGICYTNSSRGAATFSGAASLCPSGTIVPSEDDINVLDSVLSGSPSWDWDTSQQYWTSTYKKEYYYYFYFSKYHPYTSTDASGSTQKQVVCKIDTGSSIKVDISATFATVNTYHLYINYGGYAVVAVTPGTGGYLSSVGCPGGYTCSGYHTGTAFTGQQFIVVKNNSTSQGGTITIDADIADSPWKNITNMTQMTTALCNAAPTGYTKSLTDTRNSEKYEIVKLADGKCWMARNLRLVDKALTSSDSNVPSSGYTVPASSLSVSGQYGADGGWCNGNMTSANNCWWRGNVYDSGSYEYGAYYSFGAATAGTAASGTTSQYSICPKSWHLPTGAEMQTMYNHYGTFDDLVYGPLKATMPGRVYLQTSYTAIVDGAGSSGSMWTSTNNYSQWTYYLSYERRSGGDTHVYYTSDVSTTGRPVRCVFGG
ncbi:InlB B-repeat-containing protein [Candidatus Saccharibacteria bacterium]|nr:InlB B-repeat-containing protein [Candidatus Saccharibacteria bacterium]